MSVADDDGGACCAVVDDDDAGSAVVATSDFNADFGGAAPLLGLFEESGEGENACAEAASRMAAVTVVTFTIMYRRGRFSSSIYVGFGLGVLLILPALFFLLLQL